MFSSNKQTNTPVSWQSRALPVFYKEADTDSHLTVITDIPQVSLMITMSVTHTTSRRKSEARRGIGRRFPEAEDSSLITRSFTD